MKRANEESLEDYRSKLQSHLYKANEFEARFKVPNTPPQMDTDAARFRAKMSCCKEYSDIKRVLSMACVSYQYILSACSIYSLHLFIFRPHCH